MRVLASAVATALLSSVTISTDLAAQAGAFTLYGAGCASTGGTSCLSANLNQPFSGNLGVLAPFGLLVNTGSSTRVICGVELTCKTRNNSSVNMNVWIYDKASNGLPGNILRSSTMPVTGTVQANRANFSPLVVLANTDFFIVFDNSVDLNLPIVTTGTINTHVYLSGTTWRGPFNSVRWSYNVMCCSAGPVPKISTTGVPTIGKPFSLDLSAALPNAKALLAVGLTKNNLDLTFIGAPGCTLLTSPLAVLGFTTSAMGTLSLPQSVPNDSTLVGVLFYTQFAVNDPVNAAKLVVSAGGEGKVGK